MAIDRTRFNTLRLRKLFSGKTDKADDPLNPFEEAQNYRLPFKRTPYEEYTLDDGQICLNGIQVSSLIDTHETDIPLWTGLVAGVQEYRNAVWLRYGTNKPHFNAQAQGLLEKLLNKLTHVYEEMTGGIKVQLQGDKLWINDIDPKVVLNLFLSNPNEERRRYLTSIQTKLGLILAGKTLKSPPDGVLQVAKRMYHQIETALQDHPSSHPVRLLADGRHPSR